MLPNPYTFPLVPYPGPAPETAPRSGMGGWEPYALQAPDNKLLPFVLARAVRLQNSAWVNCARLEHADTSVLIADLVPVGEGVAVPPLGLVLSKYPDQGAGVEHFAYLGAVIPGLSALVPCGTPVRLVLDDAYQSPRFICRPDVATACLALEWHHPRPLSGVPYGAGLRQRLFVEGAALALLDPRTEKDVNKNPDSGAETTVSQTDWAQRSLSTEPLPAYLAEALLASSLHATFTADGEPWRVVSAKSTVFGDEGGRYTVALTLESLAGLTRASCGAPVPVAAAYNPATDAPRPWRCGDASDAAPDFQPSGTFECDVDENGNNGNVNLDTVDINPNSPSYQQTGSRPGGFDLVRCPLPPLYSSAKVFGTTTRDDCASGSVGSAVYYEVPAGQFTLRTTADPVATQAALDAQAQAYYDANAQANANALGYCNATGSGGVVYWQPQYDEMGCFTCQMVNQNDAADVRAATGAEIDQFRVNNVFYQGAIRSCPACNV